VGSDFIGLAAADAMAQGARRTKACRSQALFSPDFDYLGELAIWSNASNALMDMGLTGIGTVRRWRGG
jgi:hypothetical protein